MKRSEIAVKITECNQKQSKQKLLGKWNQVAGSMQSFHNTQVCKKIYAMKWSATKQVMPVFLKDEYVNHIVFSCNAYSFREMKSEKLI